MSTVCGFVKNVLSSNFFTQISLGEKAVVKAKKGGNSFWSVHGFNCLKPRHIPSKNRWAAGQDGAFQQLSLGSFAYARISLLQNKNPTGSGGQQSQVLTPPGTTRAHQSRGSSEQSTSHGPATSWKQKTLRRNCSSNAGRAQEWFQFLLFGEWTEASLSLLPWPMSDANQQHDIYTPSPGRSLLTMQPGQSFHAPDSFSPDKSKDILNMRYRCYEIIKCIFSEQFS